MQQIDCRTIAVWFSLAAHSALCLRRYCSVAARNSQPHDLVRQLIPDSLWNRESFDRFLYCYKRNCYAPTTEGVGVIKRY